MKPVEIGEVITFDDGTEYEVVDIVSDNGIRYMYMAKEDGDEELDILIGKEKIENGEIIVDTVYDEAEIDKVFDLLSKKQTGSAS